MQFQIRGAPGTIVGMAVDSENPVRHNYWRTLILFWTNQSCAKVTEQRPLVQHILPLLPSAPLPTAKFWDTVLCQRNVSGPSANSFLLSQPGLRRTSRIRQGRQSSSPAVMVALGRKQHGYAPSYTFTTFFFKKIPFLI